MDYCGLLLTTKSSELCNVVDARNLLRNPMRMEILQHLCGGHALSRGSRKARALANDDTTDYWNERAEGPMDTAPDHNARARTVT